MCKHFSSEHLSQNEGDLKDMSFEIINNLERRNKVWNPISSCVLCFEILCYQMDGWWHWLLFIRTLKGLGDAVVSISVEGRGE